jgi:hypothetical protein
MKKLFVLLFALISLNSYAQKAEKNLKYYYYYANQDQDFTDYLKAKREFDKKKIDFKLPSSKEALKELETNESKIFKSEKTYAEFLSRYGMTNAGEYAELWFNQMQSLKAFLKKNPEFYNLTAKERQNIVDKWYFSDVASN